MTKEDLRKHCEKTIEFHTRCLNAGEDALRFFGNRRVLEEHQLILESLDADAKWLKVIEDIKAEIEALDIEDVCAKEHGCHKEVIEIIDRKVNEVKGAKA